ncbi:MAG: hypothetical protein P8Y99_07660 [Calditrichaceae bacterium]
MIHHYQVIHFPIALLITALIFELISYFWKKESLELTSLILLILGTIGAFIAMQTGEAAADIAKKISGIGPTLHEHEETAELVAYLYFVITIIKAALMKLKKDVIPWRLFILVGMLVGTLLIFRAGHYGGQLVYEWGAGVKPVLEQIDNTMRDE